MRKYQKAEVIFEQHSQGEEMYILRSGKVRLVLGGNSGAEVGTLEQPGDFFGEMALIDGSARSATAIAEENDTELEVLDRGSFLEMMKSYPEFALDIMRQMSERVRLGNILYREVVKEAMSPFCRQNCLGKTMDAFARHAMSEIGQTAANEAVKMPKWKCMDCDYTYVPEYGDPDRGIPAGTLFEDLPDSWTCPECGATKDRFQKVG
jgi:rubredoxin/signal-transduction protein with cAMP-binding, CBS, and nucleotidyltransferase domain